MAEAHPQVNKKNVCGFCKHGDEKEAVEICGQLWSNRLVDGHVCSAHLKCMQYSASLRQYRFSSFGGFIIDKVLAEIKRGRRLRCYICMEGNDKRKKAGVRRGATSGCAYSSCRKTYHFYCVATSNSAFHKRLVVKGSGRKQVLYRVFCSEEHEALYRTEWKKDIRAQTNAGSSSDESLDEEQENNDADHDVPAVQGTLETAESVSSRTKNQNSVGSSMEGANEDISASATWKKLNVSVSHLGCSPYTEETPAEDEVAANSGNELPDTSETEELPCVEFLVNASKKKSSTSVLSKMQSSSKEKNTLEMQMPCIPFSDDENFSNSNGDGSENGDLYGSPSKRDASASKTKSGRQIRAISSGTTPQTNPPNAVKSCRGRPQKDYCNQEKSPAEHRKPFKPPSSPSGRFLPFKNRVEPEPKRPRKSPAKPSPSKPQLEDEEVLYYRKSSVSSAELRPKQKLRTSDAGSTSASGRVEVDMDAKSPSPTLQELEPAASSTPVEVPPNMTVTADVHKTDHSDSSDIKARKNAGSSSNESLDEEEENNDADYDVPAVQGALEIDESVSSPTKNQNSVGPSTEGANEDISANATRKELKVSPSHLGCSLYTEETPADDEMAANSGNELPDSSESEELPCVEFWVNSSKRKSRTCVLSKMQSSSIEKNIPEMEMPCILISDDENFSDSHGDGSENGDLNGSPSKRDVSASKTKSGRQIRAISSRTTPQTNPPNVISCRGRPQKDDCNQEKSLAEHRKPFKPPSSPSEGFLPFKNHVEPEPNRHRMSPAKSSPSKPQLEDEEVLYCRKTPVSSAELHPKWKLKTSDAGSTSASGRVEVDMDAESPSPTLQELEPAASSTPVEVPPNMTVTADVHKTDHSDSSDIKARKNAGSSSNESLDEEEENNDADYDVPAVQGALETDESVSSPTKNQNSVGPSTKGANEDISANATRKELKVSPSHLGCSLYTEETPADDEMAANSGNELPDSSESEELPCVEFWVNSSKKKSRTSVLSKIQSSSKEKNIPEMQMPCIPISDDENFSNSNGDGSENGDLNGSPSKRNVSASKMKSGRQIRAISSRTTPQTNPPNTVISCRGRPQKDDRNQEKSPAEHKKSFKPPSSPSGGFLPFKNRVEPEPKGPRMSSTEPSPSKPQLEDEEVLYCRKTPVSSAELHPKWKLRTSDAGSTPASGRVEVDMDAESPSPTQQELEPAASSTPVEVPPNMTVTADVHKTDHSDSSDELALCFPLFERWSGPEVRDLVNTHFPNSHRRICVWQDLQTDMTMSADVLIHFIQDVVKAVSSGEFEELKSLLLDSIAIQKKIDVNYSYAIELLKKSELHQNVSEFLCKKTEENLKAASRLFACQVGKMIETAQGGACVLILNDKTDPGCNLRQCLCQLRPMFHWQPTTQVTRTIPSDSASDLELQKLKLWLCDESLSSVDFYPCDELLREGNCSELDNFLKSAIGDSCEPLVKCSKAVVFHAMDSKIIHEFAYVQKALRQFFSALEDQVKVIVMLPAAIVEQDPRGTQKLKSVVPAGWDQQVLSVFDPALEPVSWVILVYAWSGSATFPGAGGDGARNAEVSTPMKRGSRGIPETPSPQSKRT